MSRIDEIVASARAARALQRVGELRALVELVDALNPSTVLEIGTCHGGTLRAWCECAADDALIVSIDLPGGPFGGGYSPARQQEMGCWARADQRIEFVQANSHDMTVWTTARSLLLGDPPNPYRGFDFLFIDGDHTYEGASSDFESYGPLVRSGGLIALHDVVPNPEDESCQVHRLWADLGERFEVTTIRTDGDYSGCGIGVLKRPAMWP